MFVEPFWQTVGFVFFFFFVCDGTTLPPRDPLKMPACCRSSLPTSLSFVLPQPTHAHTLPLILFCLHLSTPTGDGSVVVALSFLVVHCLFPPPPTPIPTPSSPTFPPRTGVIVAAAVLLGVYFAPRAQTHGPAELYGGGQWLVPLHASPWSDDAVVAAGVHRPGTLVVHRLPERPSLVPDTIVCFSFFLFHHLGVCELSFDGWMDGGWEMEQQTYSTVAWDLELSRGYWDRRPFFLAEGSTVQWAVQTESAEPAAFYVFGSAAAYADYAAHRRTAPLVAANGTHFAGNLTADNYGEYVFVVEARAHTALHWQLRFWRTRLSPAAARESCTVDHSICRLRTSKRVCPRSSLSCLSPFLPSTICCCLLHPHTGIPSC